MAPIIAPADSELRSSRSFASLAANPVGVGHNRGVEKSSLADVEWQVWKLPTKRWRQRLVRNLARATVRAPDGHRYSVKVVRVLWPGTGSHVIDRASDLADSASNFVPFGTVVELASLAVSLANASGVWGVRLLRTSSTRFPSRHLVYGEEWRDPSTALLRAHEIAKGLSAGQKP